MTKTRLEAFSDAVIAIIITIMVLELRVPHGARVEDLAPLIPVLLSYVLSFTFIGIYWNNHHHMLHAVSKVDGRALWANLQLLFWLSLVPFVTGWMGENSFAPVPVLFYGVVLFMAGLAYYILARTLVTHHSENSTLARAIGTDRKGKLSLLLYAMGIATALWNPWLAMGLYIVVAVMWFIPDRRIERNL